MFGLEEQLSAAMHPVVKDWLGRVAAHLPENPTLAAGFMQVNSMAPALKLPAVGKYAERDCKKYRRQTTDDGFHLFIR